MKPSNIRCFLTGFGCVVAGCASAQDAWTLERAIGHALTNSPEARIVASRIDAARAKVEQADALLWPRLQFESSYVRTDNPMRVFGSILNQRAYTPSLDFNDVPDLDNLNVQGILTMPLYAGGRIDAGREAARANSELAAAEGQVVRHTLAFEVARAFHAVHKARAFIRTAEAGVRAFEHNLGTVSNRMEVGTALKTDLLDMQVRLAQAREDLVGARNARTLSLRAFQTVLGLDEEVEVAETVPVVTAPSGAGSQGRPELVAVHQARRVALARKRQAKSGYRPHVNAFGSVDYDEGWETGRNGHSYTAGVVLQWDLWDGNLTRSRVSEEQAHVEAAREQERRTRLAIDFEVEQARLALQDADERLGVSATAVKQAEESVALTRIRFEQGLVLASQVIDAETALIAARVRRIKAETDQRIAIAALRKALGLPQLDAAAWP